MAGSMQPISMIAMVLQRRMQAPEPDMQAIAKNTASISALTKDAMAAGMDAMGWLTQRDDAPIELQAGLQEMTRMLTIELSACGLQLVSEAGLHAPQVPRGFVRTVLVAAVLAFCDGPREAGTLSIRVESSLDNGSGGMPGSALIVRRTPDPEAAGFAESLAPTRTRPIGWDDVQALASLFGVPVTLGAGWVKIRLPQ